MVETLLLTVSRSVLGDAAVQPKFSHKAYPSEVVSLLRYAGTGIRVLPECLASAHRRGRVGNPHRQEIAQP